MWNSHFCLNRQSILIRSRFQVSKSARFSSPFDLPLLFLKSFVNRLGYAGFHQVNISNDLRGERIAQVLVKPAILQIICQRTSNRKKINKINYHSSNSSLRIIAYHPFWGSRWGSGTTETNPRCRVAVRQERHPCQRRKMTKISRRAPPAGRWTRQKPRHVWFTRVYR